MAELVDHHWHSADALAEIEAELAYRSTKSAMTLLKKIQARTPDLRRFGGSELDADMPLREAMLVAADHIRREVLRSATLDASERSAISRARFAADGRYTRLGGTASWNGEVRLSTRYFSLTTNRPNFREVVLHELAHVLTDCQSKARGAPSTLVERASLQIGDLGPHGVWFQMSCARLGVAASEFHHMERTPLSSAQCDALCARPADFLAEAKNCTDVPAKFSQDEWIQNWATKRREANENEQRASRITCGLIVLGVVVVLFLSNC